MNENRYHSMPVSHAAQSSTTRNPGGASPEGRRLVASIAARALLRRTASIPPDTSDNALKPRGPPLPHLNFARNSPATLSNFESTSLEFCGFLKVVNLSDHRITCEIDGELRCAEPNASTRSPVRTLACTNHEPARTNIDIPGVLWSVDEHSRHGRRIVMACARLRRWCARSHFALQLLGF